MEDFGQKLSFSRSKTVFLGQEVRYYMANIAYYSEFNLQICKNDASVAKIANTRQMKNFKASFANFCHPGTHINKWNNKSYPQS